MPYFKPAGGDFVKRTGDNITGNLEITGVLRLTSSTGNPYIDFTGKDTAGNFDMSWSMGMNPDPANVNAAFGFTEYWSVYPGGGGQPPATRVFFEGGRSRIYVSQAFDDPSSARAIVTGKSGSQMYFFVSDANSLTNGDLQIYASEFGGTNFSMYANSGTTNYVGNATDLGGTSQFELRSNGWDTAGGLGGDVCILNFYNGNVTARIAQKPDLINGMIMTPDVAGQTLPLYISGSVVIESPPGIPVALKVGTGTLSGTTGTFSVMSASTYLGLPTGGGGGVTVANNTSNAYYYPMFATASSGQQYSVGISVAGAGQGLIFDPAGPTSLLGVGKAPTFSLDVSGSYINQEQPLAGFGGYVMTVMNSGTAWLMWRPGGTKDCRFYNGTAAVDVMTLSGTGVGIGTTAPVDKLQVNGSIVVGSATGSRGKTNDTITIGSTTSAGSTTPVTIDMGGTFSSLAGSWPKLRLWNDNSTSASFYGLGVSAGEMDFMVPSAAKFGFFVSGALVATLDTLGNMSATDFVATSDARLKSQVQSIYGALDTVSHLNGVTFVKKGETNRKMGVIAQDVRPYVPEVVGEGPDGMLNVMYGNLAGLFIEAIKDLKKENEELRRRLADVERRMG